VGNCWNVMRVRSARSYYQLPAFAQSYPPREVTLQEAARRLSVSQSIVRRMIEEKILPARQVVLCAPWQIPMEALDSEAIRQEAANMQNRVRVPQSQSIEGQQSIFSEG
jgi:excisionase family DNA binding protein